MSEKELNNIRPEATFLGKQTSYPSSYNNTVLVAVPRVENREIYGIIGNEFVGVDVWHGYEVSCLLNNGLPLVGILKVSYSSNSHSIVESKSFKLYLNSFNNEKLGETVDVATRELIKRIEKDLSDLLEVEVMAELHTSHKSTLFDFTNYRLLESEVDIRLLNCDAFNEDPKLLKRSKEEGELRIASQLLRSRCKVTNQPDWGNVYIYLKGKQLPEQEGLLKYLVSFREENHFHEEVCEMIYSRLRNIFKPEELMVVCLYTRRGGLDICPIRASNKRLLKLSLTDVKQLTKASFRQ